jgi:hypothetical protein
MPEQESKSGIATNPETENLLTQEQRINLETARIGWQELQRYFAMGVLIVVERELDLVSIASAFIEDDSNRIQPLMSQGNVRKAGTGDAKRWNQANTEFWAVVVAPWVLVQENGQEFSRPTSREI